MYGLFAAVGLVGAVVFGVLFFSAGSAPQETAAATAASAALLFAATMMLGHIAEVLNAQKEELRRQTAYLKWMQETAESMIGAYVTSRSRPSSVGAASPQNPATQYTTAKEPGRH